MSLSDRINEGKAYDSRGLRRCSNKTCNELYETDTQSPVCPDCKKIVQDKLTEEIMEAGYGYTH